MTRLQNSLLQLNSVRSITECSTSTPFTVSQWKCTQFYFSCPVLTKATKLSISKNNLQTALLRELSISWRKIPCVQLLSIYIEKRLQDILNGELCGQQNLRINSSELMFFIMEIVPTWKYFEFEISTPYYESFVLKIVMTFFWTKPDNVCSNCC